MRLRGFRRKVYRLTYDKPGVNKRALQVKRSVDEVKKLLTAPKNGAAGGRGK